MTPDEPLQTYRPRPTFSAWIGVVLLFAFFGLLTLVVIGASARGDNYEKKRAKARVEKMETARQEMITGLTTYGWVDKAKGVVRIPINDAMKLTVAQLAQKKPAPANPIATPAASPAPATVAASPASAAASSPASAASASPAVGTSTTSAPSVSATPRATSVEGPDSQSRAQPAAVNNPPAAAPGTQPGASATPATSPGSAAAKPPAKPSPSPSPPAPGTPLPVRGKTP